MTDFIHLADITRRFTSVPPFTERLAKRLTGSRASATVVHAVEGVSLDIAQGETLGLVGESGCGKSTLGRVAAGILEASMGSASVAGEAVMSGGRKRNTRIQMVFQDPFASLDPRRRLREILGAPLELHGIASGTARERRVDELLELVGLAPHQRERYPHEFSGGQRQRIGIARALSVEPDLIVGDEPVAALDVSIQAQIINLLIDLKARFGLSLLVVSHDLAVVAHISDRVAVMYLGRFVEVGPVARIFAQPRHPYTQALLAAVVRPAIAQIGKRTVLPGDIASAIAPPSGCRFRTRCPHAKPRCAAEVPPLETTPEGTAVACHLWRELDAAPGFSPEAGSPRFRARLAILRDRRTAASA